LVSGICRLLLGRLVDHPLRPISIREIIGHRALRRSFVRSCSTLALGREAIAAVFERFGLPTGID